MSNTKLITGWSYGLVQDNDHGLILCEVYWRNKKPVGLCYVHWKDIRDTRSRKLVMSDIRSQLRVNSKRTRLDITSIIPKTKTYIKDK